MQQPFPDQRDHHRRQQHRVKEHATPETAPDDLAVQHQRGRQRQQDHQNDLDEAEFGSVEDGAPEHVLATGLDVKVVAAFEQNAKVLGPGEGSLERHEFDATGCSINKIDDDRQEGEEAKHQKVGRNKQPADAREAQQALPQAEQRLEEIEEQSEGARHPRHLNVCRGKGKRSRPNLASCANLGG